MNNQVEIKIINQSPYPLPEYTTSLSAGLDIRANIESPIELEPLQRVAVPTGLYIALPEGYEAQIRPRSGLALKHGLTLLNAPGTIDADYRGEIKAIVANLSDTKYTIEPGERICQMVVAKHAHVTWHVTEALEETERGAGGFGHTGIK